MLQNSLHLTQNAHQTLLRKVFGFLKVSGTEKSLGTARLEVAGTLSGWSQERGPFPIQYAHDQRQMFLLRNIHLMVSSLQLLIFPSNSMATWRMLLKTGLYCVYDLTEAIDNK